MYNYIPLKSRFSWADVVMLACVGALIYAVIGVAQHWTGKFQPTLAIDLSPRALPRYSFFSLIRALVGYSISLAFTVVYGYVAAKLRRSEAVLIPFLDILQSIPVFGFLPGLVIGLMSLFPSSNLGLELACVIMLATGQAWNMTFSFYHSLKGVPKDLVEAASVMRLNWFQRLLRLELPFSAVGLAWNSLMSMAGGWFFLTVCESFTLEDRQFHLPGIGSYMAVAIERGDRAAIVYGIVAMCAVIVFVDFVIWRPVLAWVQKFQMEETESHQVYRLPFVMALLAESRLLSRVRAWRQRRLRERKLKRAMKRFRKGPRGLASSRLLRRDPLSVAASSSLNGEGALSDPLQPLELQREDAFDDGEDDGGAFARLGRYASRHADDLIELGAKLLPPLAVLLTLWGGTRVWELIRTLAFEDWKQIWRGVGFTGVRVLGAVVLSSLWTIPFGVFVGLSPRLTRLFQPVVQIAASFPAPMIYPLVLTVMFKLGVGIRWGSMFLMFFGVQWYVLFNVLAGASSIPRDLKDGFAMMGAGAVARWRRLYLPSIFPYLGTGWVTAAGGAWNACIVAEYIQYDHETLIAPGIGAMICRATAAADFARLAGCIIAMVVVVVVLNRTLWHYICELGETRFR